MGNLSSSPSELYRPPSPPTPLDGSAHYFIESERSPTSAQEGSGQTILLPVVYVSGGRALPRPASRAGRQNPGHVLLYCHGHDVDLGALLGRLCHLSGSLGLDVLAFDYGGYGLSRAAGADPPAVGSGESDNGSSSSASSLLSIQRWSDGDSNGSSSSSNDGDNGAAAARILSPSEGQCYNDVSAVYAHLTSDLGVDPADIILYGKGLGSGPACWLARKLCLDRQRRREEVEGRCASGAEEAVQEAAADAARPAVGGLVLHSPFLSASPPRSGDCVSGCDVWAPSRGDEAHKEPPLFPNEEHLRDVLSLSSVAIYVIHGTNDRVVPCGHGAGLYEAVIGARGRSYPPFWAEGCGHSDVEQRYATAYVKRLQQFARQCDKTNGVLTRPNYFRPERPSRRALLEVANRVPLGGREEDLTRGDPTAPAEKLGRSGSRRGLSRSWSRARQRKKKGTLVMRGWRDDDGGDPGPVSARPADEGREPSAPARAAA